MALQRIGVWIIGWGWLLVEEMGLLLDRLFSIALVWQDLNESLLDSEGKTQSEGYQLNDLVDSVEPVWISRFLFLVVLLWLGAIFSWGLFWLVRSIASRETVVETETEKQKTREELLDELKKKFSKQEELVEDLPIDGEAKIQALKDYKQKFINQADQIIRGD